MWTQTTDNLKSKITDLKPEHRPSIKGTKSHSIVIKAIIIISGVQKASRQGSAERRGAQAPGSCDKSLDSETNQQTKTTSQCKVWPEYGSTAWYMDRWGEFEKDLYQGAGEKGRHPPAFLRYMGSGLHAETGCRPLKVYVGVFEWQKIPWKRRRRFRMAVTGITPKAFFSQKWAICNQWVSGHCRLCRIAKRSKVRALTVWQLKQTVTSTVHWQAAKGWQQQLRLPTTPSGGTYMTACCTKDKKHAQVLHAWQETLVTWARCGDGKSF